MCTGGQTYLFPESRSQESNEGDLEAEIRVRSDTFWIRLCLMGDLGFAEAYMYGEVECDDLVSLFKVRYTRLPRPSTTLRSPARSFF